MKLKSHTMKKQKLFQQILMKRNQPVKRRIFIVVVCFAALWDSLLKSQAKKYHPFPCIPIFNKC